MRPGRSEIFWLVVIGLVLLLGVWWFPGTTALKTDSHSVTRQGKKVLFETLQRLDSDVRRSGELLVPRPGQRDRVLILGPARYPSDLEWIELSQMVASGGSLIFAAREGEPVELTGFGVRVDSTLVKEAPATSAEAKLKKAEKDLEKLDRDMEELLGLTEPGTGWSPHNRIVTTSGTWTTLHESGGSVHVAKATHGAGEVIVLSSDVAFDNSRMIDPVQALRAYRIVSAAKAEGRTWFDETLNATGVPKVVGLLFDPEFRPLSLQLLLVLVLFGWSGARHFGPTMQRFDTRRRSIVEHAQALGQLYFRCQAHQQAVTATVEYFHHELRTKLGARFRVDDAGAIARQVQRDESHVRSVLDAAEAISSGVPTTSQSAAYVLRELARLRQGLSS